MTYPPQQPDPNQPAGEPYPPQQPGAYPPPGYPAAPPAAPVKKGLGTGKLLLIIAACLIALCCVGGIIAAAVGGGSKNSNQSSSSNTSVTAPTTGAADAAAAKTQAAAPKQAQPKQAQPKVGQPARDGKFEFTVTQVEYGKTQVGNEFANKKAQGQFVLVHVTVKNIGTEARTFTGATQRALGEGGVKYENDGSAEIYANTDNQTFLNTINPGNQVQGILVFDIPSDKKITAVQLHDSMFSGGVTVDLT